MATVNPTRTQVGGDDSCFLVKYTLTTADNDGAPLSAPEWYDRVFTATGTFGGATIILEGSNDGASYVPLKDASGTAISLTAAGMFHLLATPVFVRPRLSVVGAGASIVAGVLCRRPTELRT